MVQVYFLFQAQTPLKSTSMWEKIKMNEKEARVDKYFVQCTDQKQENGMTR